MKIFIAGGTGAIGHPLVRRLLERGHDVVGITRSPQNARSLRAQGVEAVVADACDEAGLLAAVKRAEPEVVIDELTDLPQKIRLRGLRKFYRHQNRVRSQGSAALLHAARAVGARKLIAQSVAFIYAPNGGGLKTEEDSVWSDAPRPFGDALRTAAEHDAAVTTAEDLVGVVLRYGVFYGPDTHFAPGNGTHSDAMRRRLPIVGDGSGVWSFIHVDDAAAATVAALDRAPRGIYNVVDDDPAPYREWVPYYASAIGAKPPRHVPAWLARWVAGPAITSWATVRPGASNAKARRELGWSPGFTSWRSGFREGLDERSEEDD